MEVRIHDSGIGIPEEQKRHIFERFSIKRILHEIVLMEGSGLGLAIVKKVLDLHQGEIKVESVEGNGTALIAYS